MVVEYLNIMFLWWNQFKDGLINKALISIGVDV